MLASKILFMAQRVASNEETKGRAEKRERLNG